MFQKIFFVFLKHAFIVTEYREKSILCQKTIFLLLCKHMNINGKQIADTIKLILKERVLKRVGKPKLAIVYVGKDPIIEGFLRIKRRTGEDVGVETVLHHFPHTVSQKTLIAEIQKIATDKNFDGMIVQLPLPEGFDTEIILDAIPTEKDVDVLSKKDIELFDAGKLSILPPVVGAIMEILKQNEISVSGKNAVVLGNGRLVGKPITSWLKQNGATVIVLDKIDGDPTAFLQKADIIVSGTGVAGIIKPEMIQQGVMLFDAGASEEAGETKSGIKGDADNACSDKCAIFTPVPGGIGPITVAMLFKNLLDTTERKNMAMPSAGISLD
jgi:methylenetetrahydrofolate dehydrogenase (NADP+)/methenyltetrahydrofolate cyclohydrolase